MNTKKEHCMKHIVVMFWLFQKDYWSIDDEELVKLAQQYHIPDLTRAGKGGETWAVDREGIIQSLLSRDNALRTNVSLIAMWISPLATILNIVITLLEPRW